MLLHISPYVMNTYSYISTHAQVLLYAVLSPSLNHLLPVTNAHDCVSSLNTINGLAWPDPTASYYEVLSDSWRPRACAAPSLTLLEAHGTMMLTGKVKKLLKKQSNGHYRYDVAEVLAQARVSVKSKTHN